MVEIIQVIGILLTVCIILCGFFIIYIIDKRKRKKYFVGDKITNPGAIRDCFPIVIYLENDYVLSKVCKKNGITYIWDDSDCGLGPQAPGCWRIITSDMKIYLSTDPKRLEEYYSNL